MLFKSILFSLCLVIEATSPDIIINELPHDISRDLQNVHKIQQEDIVRCQHRINTNTQFFLYNRDQRTNPLKFNPQEIDISGKKLIILIHGWLSSYNSSKFRDLKNAYLNKYDANVLMVDWSKGSMQPYKKSYCHIVGVSQILSKLLCYVTKKTKISLGDVHTVGHSTGSHIAGLTGHFTLNRCKAKLGRITALDPPNEQGNIQKLSKTSANYVDVIHTDDERFGSRSKRIGHADFFVNCGTSQPGCKSFVTISDDDLLSDVMCSHLRSIELMTESIGGSNAIAVSCANCPRYCRPDVISEIYNLMGENASPHRSSVKSFLIFTNDVSPYFTAWDRYQV